MLLQDLFKQIVTENSDYGVIQTEVMSVCDDNLVSGITDEQVGMVVCEFVSDVIPEQCLALFKRNRNTIVVGLVNDCRQFAIFADVADLELIKSVLKYES